MDRSVGAFARADGTKLWEFDLGADVDAVEQGAVAQDRADRLLRHLLQVVARHLTGDDDLGVVGDHHQSAELAERAAREGVGGFG